MKGTASEIQKLADALGEAGAYDQAERLLAAGTLLAETPTEEQEGESKYDQVEKMLNEHLKPLKKHGWWDPGHNFVINWALMGLNTWRFMITAHFAHHSQAHVYREADPKHGTPEGLILDPSWRPIGNNTYPESAKVVEALIKLLKEQPTIQETIRQEIAWIDTKYGIKVPSALESNLLSTMPKVAQRRWGTDGLRRKKMFFPLDGSKPREMGSWGDIR
jgi:hypothetical protein